MLFCLSGAGCQKREYISIFLLKSLVPSCLQSKEGPVSFWLFFSKLSWKKWQWQALLLLHSWFQNKACFWTKYGRNFSFCSLESYVQHQQQSRHHWELVWSSTPVIGEILGFIDADCVHRHRIIKVCCLWMTGAARPMALLPLPGGSRVRDVPKTITICFLNCSWLLIALTLTPH